MLRVHDTDEPFYLLKSQVCRDSMAPFFSARRTISLIVLGERRDKNRSLHRDNSGGTHLAQNSFLVGDASLAHAVLEQTGRAGTRDALDHGGRRDRLNVRLLLRVCATTTTNTHQPTEETRLFFLGESRSVHASDGGAGRGAESATSPASRNECGRERKTTIYTIDKHRASIIA